LDSLTCAFGSTVTSHQLAVTEGEVGIFREKYIIVFNDVN